MAYTCNYCGAYLIFPCTNDNDARVCGYRMIPAEDRVKTEEATEKASALSTQVGGDHYKKLKIQPMEYSMANGLDACQHTAIKYITRFRDKGTPLQDLEKAIHAIEMLIEFEGLRKNEG